MGARRAARRHRAPRGALLGREPQPLDADLSRELESVRAWLQRLGDVELDLIVFRNVPEKAHAFASRRRHHSARAAPEGAQLRRGTAIETLPLDLDVAYNVLVSDGLANLGAIYRRDCDAIYP